MVAGITTGLLDGCSYPLEASGWLVFFLGGLRVVAVISWTHPDGCCCFLEASGRLPLLPGGYLVVTIIS